ncbi:hypothetical protein SVAN01_06667 [Stagonosporopsis vannaccii]|nr:hypothetical protein SVAN01_06667 [Stagonosporopsis vannaccii]
MPLKSNKRPAPEVQGGDSTKKICPTSTNKADDDVEYEPIQITCQLYKDYDKFPEALRTFVEKRYTDDVYEILQSYHNNQPASQKFTYRIIEGADRQDSSVSNYKTVRVQVYRNASMANVAVLEHFRKLMPPKKTYFVKAPDEMQSNPDYAKLNSVTAGQIGWGFDEHGCLSLRKTSVEESKLRHDFMYVERRKAVVVKREKERERDDDECAIIDDPRMLKE